MKNLFKVFAVLLLILAVVVGGTVLILRNSKPANQPIFLPDGTTLRFLGITVGTNHVYGSKLWNVVNRLPGFVSKPVLKFMGKPPFPTTVTTGQTNLVVWVEHSGPVPGIPVSRLAMLRVPGGRLSGPEPNVYFSRRPGQSNSIHSFRFEGWQRRAERIECVFFEKDTNYKNVVVGSIQFDNPFQTTGPAWSPDPIPTTKSTGDLNVTLLDFATGFGNSTTQRSTSSGGWEVVYTVARTNGEPGSVVRVSFDSPRGTNETWIMFNIDLSDAPGNQMRATTRSGMTTNMLFRPVLWPDEPAWKVKLHLKRKTGFASNELITFSNVPLPAIGTTNQLMLTNTVMGIQTVFTKFIRRPPLTNNNWNSSQMSRFHLEHDTLGDTNQIDLVSITVHPMGTNMTTSGSSWSDNYHEHSLKSVPTNATHMDFVFSIQKARFVEFTIDPNWVTNDYVIKER